jgi:hypothetical protein
VFAQRGWLDAAAVAGVAFCQHVVQREKLRACAPRNVRRPPLGPKTNEKEMKKKHPPADAASWKFHSRKPNNGRKDADNKNKRPSAYPKGWRGRKICKEQAKKAAHGKSRDEKLSSKNNKDNFEKRVELKATPCLNHSWIFSTQFPTQLLSSRNLYSLGPKFGHGCMQLFLVDSLKKIQIDPVALWDMILWI